MIRELMTTLVVMFRLLDFFCLSALVWSVLPLARGWRYYREWARMVHSRRQILLFQSVQDLLSLDPVVKKAVLAMAAWWRR